MTEMICDLFAGAGGASCGIAAAFDREPDIAINHDRIAIEVHAANHKETKHFNADIWSVDPQAATKGKDVKLLWASPDCRHFSRAKGGPICSPKVRSLAWVVIRWAALCRPAHICVENVEEFRSWGPLGHDNKPCKQLAGADFERWVSELNRLGYRVEWRVLDASDFGAPTSRRRLFIQAHLEKIIWPATTHATQKNTARDCLQLSDPGTAISQRKRKLAPRTMDRIARGREKFGSQWIAKYYGAGTGQSIDEPLHTITCRDRFALVTHVKNETHYRMLRPDELLAAQFGMYAGGYSLDAAKTHKDKVRLVGNSVCPEIVEAILRNYQ